MGLPTQSLPDPEDVTFTFKQTSAEDDDQNTLFCKLSVFKKAVSQLPFELESHLKKHFEVNCSLFLMLCSTNDGRPFFCTCNV